MSYSPVDDVIADSLDQTGPVLQAGYPAKITALCPNSAGRRRPELGLTVVLAKKVP